MDIISVRLFHLVIHYTTGENLTTILLYSKMGWTFLSVKRVGQCILFIHRAALQKVPLYLWYLSGVRETSYHNRSHDWITTKSLSASAKLVKFGFSFYAPYLRNNLQQDLLFE